MQCPKCEGQFEVLKYVNVVFERCMSCHGMWFDFAEVAELLEKQGTEMIDSGDPLVGEAMDDVRNIDCIRCQHRMLTVRHGEQRHIEYEICPECWSMFLDSGEFEDMKDFTIGEWFANLKNQLLLSR